MYTLIRVERHPGRYATMTYDEIHMPHFSLGGYVLTQVILPARQDVEVQLINFVMPLVSGTLHQLADVMCVSSHCKCKRRFDGSTNA